MSRMLITAGIAALLAAPAFAQAPSGGASKQPPGKTAAKPSSGVAAADRAFVREAAMGGMAEVELGRLGADKASSSDVKQFAQRMVDDHGKANDQLKSWASQKNLTLPSDLDAAHRATRDRLSKLSGAAFDRAYMREMVADHNKDVQAFTRASGTAKDPELKAWIDKTLPTLKEHQKMARDVNIKVAGTTPPKSVPKL